MNGETLSRVKQVNNVSIATLGLNNNFIQKYISQPNAMISKIPVIVHVALSVHLRILNVSKISLLNHVPELSVHLLGLERGLEALEELHHLGVHLEVGEVVVHPQQQHARHAVEDLLQKVVSSVINISTYATSYLDLPHATEISGKFCTY